MKGRIYINNNPGNSSQNQEKNEVNNNLNNVPENFQPNFSQETKNENFQQNEFSREEMKKVTFFWFLERNCETRLQPGLQPEPKPLL